MVALIRGLAAPGERTLGNFWVDLTRTTLRILLPIAFVVAMVLIVGGVIQNLHGFARGRRRVAGADAGDPRRAGRQPDRDQEARHQRRWVLQRQLGPPVREPERLRRLLRALRDPRHPVRAHLHVREAWSKDKRQGWAVFAVMVVIWLAFVAARASSFELNGNPKLDRGRRRTRRSTPTRPAGTSRARRSGSARSGRRSGPPRRPGPRTARSTRCTTASRRSAG